MAIGATQLDGNMRQEEGATCDALELADRHGRPWEVEEDRVGEAVMGLIAEATDQPSDQLYVSPGRDGNEFIAPALERVDRAAYFVVVVVRRSD